MHGIRSRVVTGAAVALVSLVAIGGTVALAQAGSDRQSGIDESLKDDESVKMVPDLVPVADHTGAIVGHITKAEFLDGGDPSEKDPIRAFHQRTHEVQNDDGEVVGIFAGQYGFVPAAEADAFLAKIDSGELATSPPPPPGVEVPKPTEILPPG